jgi:outer membrane protein TolC
MTPPRRAAVLVCLAVGAALATPFDLGAGETSGLTLSEALERALARNPTLASLRAEAAAAGAVAEQAESARWPRVLLDAGARYTDQPVMAFGDKLTAGTFTAGDFALDRLNDPDPIGHLTVGVSVEAPLLTSGRIASTLAASRSGAAAAGARLRAAESDLALSVIESYHAVSLAHAALDVATSALADARGHEAAAAARVDAGSALRSDLLRAQVLRLRRERDLDRRGADLEIARARLRSLMRDTGDAPADPAEPLDSPPEPSGSLMEWSERALRDRPEIAAAREGAVAAEAGERAVQAALRPEMSGLARYARDLESLDEDQGSYLLGVSLRWSVFERGRAPRLDEAAMRRASADADAAVVEDAIRLEVERAYLDAGVAFRSLHAASEAVGAAEAARRITAERYSAGLLPLTDLLDVEAQLEAARQGDLEAVYESIVTQARLARAAGALEVPR